MLQSSTPELKPVDILAILEGKFSCQHLTSVRFQLDSGLPIGENRSIAAAWACTVQVCRLRVYKSSMEYMHADHAPCFKGRKGREKVFSERFHIV